MGLKSEGRQTWGLDLPFPSRGERVDRLSQVCSEGSHPTHNWPHPPSRAGSLPPWTETRGAAAPGGRDRLFLYLSAGAESRAGPGGTDRRAASQAPSGLDSARHQSGPGSSGRSRSSSAQRALPQGSASCVPSSCSSSCSSPPRDSSRSLPPAKSLARGQPRAATTAGSLVARSPSLSPVPGRPEAHSAGCRCSEALPMAQPESRLRTPDALDRGAAQVSAERVGRGQPGSGVARRGAFEAPGPGVPDLSPARSPR